MLAFGRDAEWEQVSFLLSYIHEHADRDTVAALRLILPQWAKSDRFCRESPGMVDPWWRGILGEIWVVSEMRIHGEIEGIFGEGFLTDSPEIP